MTGGENSSYGWVYSLIGIVIFLVGVFILASERSKSDTNGNRVLTWTAYALCLIGTLITFGFGLMFFLESGTIALDSIGN
jgi:uncharacterized membrane protein